MSAGRTPTLVTGAAGFIGGAAAMRLADERDVRAAFRWAPLAPALLRRPGVEAVELDLDDFASTRAAVTGAGAVVHAAYGADAGMAPQCARLLEAMTAERVGRLVYVSSIAVYGERAGEVAEDAAASGDPGGYGAAKQACETLVRGWVAAGPDRRALILRPGVVYGAGARYWIDKMSARIAAGALGDLGPLGEGIAPLIHVDDTAALTARAVSRLDGDGLAGRVVALNLVGLETPSWNVYFAALAAALGSPPLRRLSPSEIKARQALALPAKIWRRLGLPGFSALALAPGSGELALFRRKAQYSTEAATRLLGSARTGLAEGLGRSIPRIENPPSTD